MKDRNSRAVYWQGKQSWCLAAETNLEGDNCWNNNAQDQKYLTDEKTHAQV